MKHFAEKIYELRKEKKFSQEEMGALLGVSRRMILDYEKGIRKPHKKNMKLYAEILEVPIEYLTEDCYQTPLEVFNKPSQDVLDEDKKMQEHLKSDAITELEFLKERSMALFAGGNLPEKYREDFFRSLYEAYIKSKSKDNSEE